MQNTQMDLQWASNEQQIEKQIMIMQIQQDLNNVLGIAFETQSVLDVLEDRPNDPLINVHLNRLILQINLSNHINADMKEQVGDSIMNDKKLAQSRYENMIKGEHFDQRITNYLNGYLFNISQQVCIKQIQPLPTKVTTQFNSETVQKVINSIGSTDNQYQELKKGKTYQMLSESQLKQQLLDRRDIAKAKTKIYANENKGNKANFKIWRNFCECSLI